jgi:hypothetical protein
VFGLGRASSCFTSLVFVMLEGPPLCASLQDACGLPALLIAMQLERWVAQHASLRRGTPGASSGPHESAPWSTYQHLRVESGMHYCIRCGAHLWT